MKLQQLMETIRVLEKRVKQAERKIMNEVDIAGVKRPNAAGRRRASIPTPGRGATIQSMEGSRKVHITDVRNYAHFRQLFDQFLQKYNMAEAIGDLYGEGEEWPAGQPGDHAEEVNMPLYDYLKELLQWAKQNGIA